LTSIRQPYRRSCQNLSSQTVPTHLLRFRDAARSIGLKSASLFDLYAEEGSTVHRFRCPVFNRYPTFMNLATDYSVVFCVSVKSAARLTRSPLKTTSEMRSVAVMSVSGFPSTISRSAS
jgi:hypothetical protein